jgi:hypothetical protein
MSEKRFVPSMSSWADQVPLVDPGLGLEARVVGADVDGDVGRPWLLDPLSDTRRGLIFVLVRIEPAAFLILRICRVQPLGCVAKFISLGAPWAPKTPQDEKFTVLN